jgi:pimeloyl-ACP methyl ester carboxylesterase
MTPRLLENIRDFLPEVDFSDPATIAAIREFVVPVAMFDELRKVGVAAYRAAAKISCPTLVIQGSEDVTVRPADTRRLVQRLKGPVTSLEVRAAHELVFANTPSFPQVRQAVLDFAGSVDKSAQATQ